MRDNRSLLELHKNILLQIKIPAEAIKNFNFSETISPTKDTYHFDFIKISLMALYPNSNS